jgi:hypothetical protein
MIGDRELIFSETFVIPFGGNARFDINSNATAFAIQLELTLGDGDPNAAWKLENDVFVVRLTNLRPNFGEGGGILSPVKIGQIGTKPLGLVIAVQNLNKSHVVTVNLLLGGSYV